MSIARALTTVRRVRGHSNEEPAPSTLPVRAGTLKTKDYRQVDRTKISLPVSLISTTNSLAYDAPDIPKINTMASPSSMITSPSSMITSPSSMISPSLSSASSRRSYEGSDSGASSATSISTPNLSREGSPVLDGTHLKGYFPQSPKKPYTDSTISTPRSGTFSEIEIAPNAPAVPSRALSHTKKTHQVLARQRSISRLSGENQSGQSSRAVSTDLRSVDEHPFGAELAQVMEVAEEFGVKDVCIWNEEQQFLVDQGLGQFSAEDYINEIQPLFGKAFYDGPISNLPTWL